MFCDGVPLEDCTRYPSAPIKFDTYICAQLNAFVWYLYSLRDCPRIFWSLLLLRATTETHVSLYSSASCSLLIPRYTDTTYEHRKTGRPAMTSLLHRTFFLLLCNLGNSLAFFVLMCVASIWGNSSFPHYLRNTKSRSDNSAIGHRLV